jgi:hypothetical protein
MNVKNRAMGAQFGQTSRYIQESLGVDVAPTAWSGRDRLPPLLRERYRFAEVRLLETPFLLMLDTDETEPSPATVRKHLDLIESKRDVVVIFVRPHVTAYNRKRLIEQKVPFIVPGKQMYLPTLGLDLREHFKRVRAKPQTLGPATQAVVLFALMRDADDPLTPAALSRRLGYSAMTMTRAFDELEHIQLGEITVRGRERCLRFDKDRRGLWEKAEPLLRSPCSKRVFVERIAFDTASPLAGLAALARYSMLAPPAHPVYAIERKDWKALRARHKIVELPQPDEEVQEIEVWTYRPALFAVGDHVDPLSLYLSLRGTNDERVEGALEEMMRTLRW